MGHRAVEIPGHRYVMDQMIELVMMNNNDACRAHVNNFWFTKLFSVVRSRDRPGS